MGIGESISKGFGVAKKSMSLVLLLFVFGFIFNLMNIFLAPPTGAEPPAAPSPLLVVLGIVFIFLTVYFQAGSIAFIRAAEKTGKASLADFASGGAKYYLRLLLLGIVVSLIIGAFVLAAALSAGLLQNLQVVAVPLAILFAALGVYFVVLLFLSPYAAVVDEKGVRESIKISMKLVKKNILTLLGISGLMILIGFGIGLVLGAILAGVSLAVKAEMAAQVVFAFLSSFVNSFLGVFVTAAFMAFYLSLPDRNNA